jgi:hypothetical protein
VHPEIQCNPFLIQRSKKSQYVLNEIQLHSFLVIRLTQNLYILKFNAILWKCSPHLARHVVGSVSLSEWMNKNNSNTAYIVLTPYLILSNKWTKAELLDFQKMIFRHEFYFLLVYPSLSIIITKDAMFQVG